MHVFGLWEEPGVPEENPCKHENMQTRHKKARFSIWTPNLRTVSGLYSTRSGWTIDSFQIGSETVISDDSQSVTLTNQLGVG